MIPRQLQIKNFLSYGPEIQTIDFAHYHLICLSGKNGHGKSAMLDAITWAIWGQARKSSSSNKPDAGLLHLGQKHMMVILEFEVNGQQYRIRREYLHTASKPFATVDFGLRQADDKMIVLTDKTIKDTQEKIEQTIGITYESFVNSTFLRQGQSNEFSKKSPKERKDILAQILQLKKFEDQKKIALQHTRKLQQDYAAQSSIAGRIEQELIELANIAQTYKNIQKTLHDFEQQQQDLTRQKTALNLEQQTIAQQLHEANFLQQQQEILQKNYQTAQQELTKIQQELDAQAPEINLEQLKQDEQKLQNSLQILQKAQRQKLELKENYLQLKEQIATQEKQIHERHQALTQTLNLEATKLQQMMLHGQQQQKLDEQQRNMMQHEHKQATHQLRELTEKINKNIDVKTQYLELELRFENNKAQYQNVCAQGTQVKQQLALLQDPATHHFLQQDQCELCTQPLTQTLKSQIQQKKLLEQQQTQQLLQELKIQAQQLKTDLTKQQSMLQALKTNYEQFIQDNAQRQELEKQHEKLTTQLAQHVVHQQQTQVQQSQLEQKLAQATQQIEQIAQALQQELNTTSLLEMRQKLQKLEQEILTIVYDPETYQKLEQQWSQTQQIIADFERKNNALYQTEQKFKAAQLQKNIQEIQQQLANIQTTLKMYDTAAQRKQILITQEQKIDQEIMTVQQQHKIALIEKGSLEQKQKKQLDLQSEQQSLQTSMKALHQEIFDYQEIVKALGKDGIQALLIEQAIPEIEHETNQILARLTNNQTQIFIESLRDLKKGGSRETLDIKIADSFGLRDYEMFSGGEAFRIDFALRIGISKLLARRAGTTLQTIFIDEGFGSQDEEGLQLIMDNLYKIQDDFAKIIVVSHLPEMKEQFPIQFIVEKKRSGSTISVIEQG